MTAPVIIGNATLYTGDCRDVLRTLAADSVDAIVCDPPYGLAFMGKGWDHAVPGIDYWTEALRVAKPGAHLLAFGGTRTFHRMVCAIEDAGWEIRDRILWLYGSGFPKSLDVSKAIDKAAGAERERVIRAGAGSAARTASCYAQDAWTKANGNTRLDDTPITEDAADWKGWGTALKPAHEPVIVARKPLIGTVAANVQAHGTGAINIDGCRIETSAEDAARIEAMGGFGRGGYLRHRTACTFMQGTPQATAAKAHDHGRWPANVIHDGSDEVLAAFPTSSVTGQRSASSKAASVAGTTWLSDNHQSAEYTDSGSAARFFYCAKADRADRNDGCDGLPLHPSGMVSNTSGQHITRRDGGAPAPSANNHPTVKPTDLMRYLCRLVTPPAGTVLDPFMGSGSTGRAAVAEGFSFVGIELDPAYVAIAAARIRAMQPGLSLRAIA